jgi:tetratricopeptide (TPR) repeat protein
MSLAGHKTRDIAEAQRLCGQAQHQKAISVLGDNWQGLGVVSESGDPEILLVLGTLNSELGSIQQFAGAQEAAKDMLSRAERLFEASGDLRRAEAMLQLSRCYWRCSEHDEAMILIADVLASYSDSDTRLYALTLKAVFEGDRGGDSLEILVQAEPLAGEFAHPLLRGKFHGERALALRRLSEKQPDPEPLLDRAIQEYECASVCFELANSPAYGARVLNNLSEIYRRCGQFEMAHAYLDRAAKLLMDDKANLAQVHDQRAKTFLDEGKPDKALACAKEAVSLLLPGEQKTWLQACLATQRQAIKAVKALEAIKKHADVASRKSAERERIRAALVAADGITTRAADILGLTQPGLAHKIQNQFPELASLRKVPRTRRWKRRPA